MTDPQSEGGAVNGVQASASFQLASLRRGLPAAESQLRRRERRKANVETGRLVWQPLYKALRPLCDEESGVDTREGVIVHGERDFTDRGRP